MLAELLSKKGIEKNPLDSIGTLHFSDFGRVDTSRSIEIK